MKHTLLATTALVAFTGTAYAELSITATARVGLKTTEGVASVTTAAAPAALTAAQTGTLGYLGGAAVYNDVWGSSDGVTAGTAATAAQLAASTSSSAITEIQDIIAKIKTTQLSDLNPVGSATAGQLATDLATAESFLAAALGSAASSTTATTDDTSAVNRVRVSFSGSGETDGGISYGASIRADNAAAGAAGTGGTAGSQFVSGAFGKISMGDLDGADESAAGGGVSGVGLTGLGDHNDVAYQSSGHNLSYHYTVSGLTFGYSQDTTVNSGSNSAMGVRYSGEVGGATVSFGVGQSKVATATQTSMSVSASSGGLTLKAMSSSNDNGPAGADVTARAQSGTTAATSYRAAVTGAANNDTDQTALSISYAMDGMTVTGFTKTVSTAGAADQDFSGFGFSYDMGGVTMKAGVVDNNDQQLIDFGLSFSF